MGFSGIVLGNYTDKITGAILYASKIGNIKVNEVEMPSSTSVLFRAMLANRFERDQKRKEEYLLKLFLGEKNV